MDFTSVAASAAELHGVRADGLLLLVCGDALPKGLPAPFDAALRRAHKLGDLPCRAGSTVYLGEVHGMAAPRVAVSWAADGSAKSVRKAVMAGVGLFKAGGCVNLAVAALGFSMAQEQVLGAASAAEDADYIYSATRPSAPQRPALRKLVLVCEKEALAVVKQAAAQAQAVCAGVALARECGNRPGNHATPTWLAQQAQSLGKQHGVKVQVLDRAACARLGMGAFLGVAQGSNEPPKFIVMQHLAGPKRQAPVVLVGKGITFDSGGISIKPAAEMDEMKYDMGGAASVLGTIKALALMKARLNVVGIIPACENMPSGTALKPGDVLTSMSGQTIEVLNTDAEGRLILCDALTYAQRFKPSAVVDIATLTGACIIALGHVRSGLYSNDDALAADLLAAGERALDPAWRMPLDDEYAEGLKTHYADVANVGSRAAGSVTAAKFLHRFVAGQRWAHLDIAGTAWRGGVNKGATGRPVPLLTQWLLAQQG